MPRKAVLSAAQQAALTALPTAEHDLRLHYTLSENDLSIIRSKRGAHNRLGFAIQLCYLRFPGQAMNLDWLYEPCLFYARKGMLQRLILQIFWERVIWARGCQWRLLPREFPRVARTIITFKLGWEGTVG